MDKAMNIVVALSDNVPPDLRERLLRAIEREIAQYAAEHRSTSRMVDSHELAGEAILRHWEEGRGR